MTDVESCLALCSHVGFFQSCLALRLPRLGKRELVDVLRMHLFVHFPPRVSFCPFSLPLCVRGWLRHVIMAPPGLFYQRSLDGGRR